MGGVVMPLDEALEFIANEPLFLDLDLTRKCTKSS